MVTLLLLLSLLTGMFAECSSSPLALAFIRASQDILFCFF